MKNTLRIVLAFCLLSVTLFAAEEGRFFTYPTIHNDKIVFTYESDLWVVERPGRRRLAPDDFPRDRELRQVLARRQMARLHGDLRRRPGRLSHAGRGRRARPPDLQPRRGPGHRLDARRDRDRLPVDVRERRRPRPQPLFGRRQGRRARAPAPRPGRPRQLLPEEHKFLYCRRGNEEYYWKRYKGGQYQDIWLYDAVAKTYTPVTDYVGKNSYPMWVGGLMYFVSDRGERHRQPLHPEARHQGRRAGHEVRRFRRHVARDGRPVHRLRPGRPAPRPRRRVGQGREASPSRSRPTAGPCATGSSTRATTSTRPTSATTARPSSSRPAATSSASPPAPARPRTCPGRPAPARSTRPSRPTARRSPSSATRAATTSSTPSRPRAATGRPITTDLDRTVYQLALVARREEDPLRQQGLLDLLDRRGRRRSWSRSTPPTR